MKRLKFLFIIILLGLSVIACKSKKDNGSILGQTSENSDSENGLPGEHGETMSEADEDRIRDIKYQKDGIEGRYPEFISGENEEKLDAWNQIIEKDFNKILDIYSFNPFPEPTPSPTTAVPIILNLNYDVKSNNSRFFSIIYTAAYNSPYTAHPTELVYTTNIDKEKNERLRLPDFVQIDEKFVKDFRTWDLISAVKGNEEYNQAIKDYIKNMSDKDLIMGFLAADQIGSKNLWGVYSYITSNRLGISIGVPNYIGDHVEFEKDLSQLTDFIKSKKE